MTYESETMICECGSLEHSIVFLYDKDKDDNWEEVYMFVHLQKHKFWQRLKYAIKYLFGYKAKGGAFVEIILRPEDWVKVQRVSDKLKQINSIKQ